MQLPAKPVVDSYVEDQHIFSLEVDKDVPDSRRLVFIDTGNEVMRDFRNQVIIMTNLKIYI